MNELVNKLDYKNIFKYFQEISEIPRASGNEGEISDYLVEFAKKFNLEYIQDEAMNVIIIKESSKGEENRPAIVLQAHMDMVCEKISESTHDFEEDGIKLLVEDDFIKAQGTTLGADNGIGMAYILALLSDDEIKHPRLEAIITTDEEVGMIGAKSIDLSLLKGEFMINLDSGEEGYLLSGCAGGLTGTTEIPLERIEDYGKKIKISIRGLKGGHSGADIHKNRSNATILLGRLLFEARETLGFSLISMGGGFKDNVIPREAQAEVFIPLSMDVKEGEGDKELLERGNNFIEVVSTLLEDYKIELSASEPDFDFEIEDLGNEIYKPLMPISFEKVINLLINMPYGVQVNSSIMEGLVESSLNLGIFTVGENEAIFCNSIRSSVESYKHFLSKKLEYLASFLGGKYIVRGEYPAWEYKAESKLRNHVTKLYKEIYKDEIVVEAIHAGLECGLISEKMLGIDIVSMGPNMLDIHTVDERLSISSTIRVYKFLEQVIETEIK